MRLRATLWITAAGLLSAMFGICLMPFTFYAAGAWFGAATGICLKKFRIFDNRQTSRFVIVCIVAYIPSFMLAMALSGAFPPIFYTPNPDRETSLVFAQAGALGGFLVLGAAMWLVRPRRSGIDVLIGGVCGAVSGAALAGAGRSLGPSLGTTVMKVLAPIPWFPATYEYQNYYAVFVVWQTGMALLLGLILNLLPTSKELPTSKRSVDQDQTSAVIPRWFN
ncbi:MAG TPA: hypothetical protein VFW94_07470 [Candidatus Acidoferrales bacterium]|nr:hypothetical protein [Candidatus Acidoferrales bacterium]